MMILFCHLSEQWSMYLFVIKMFFILCFYILCVVCFFFYCYVVWFHVLWHKYICVVFTIHHTQHSAEKQGRIWLFFVHHVIYSSSSSAMLLFQFMYLGNWIMFQYNNCRHLNGKNIYFPNLCFNHEFFIEARFMNIYVIQHNTCFYHFKKHESFMI